MNWNRAKNISIIVFLIVNIILFYMIRGQNEKAYTLTAEQNNIIFDILSKNDILLYSKIPKEFYPMYKMEIEPYEIDKEYIVHNILKEKEYKFTIRDNKTIYTSDDEELNISDGGEIVYKNTNGLYKPSEYNLKNILTSANRFVEDIYLDKSEYKIYTQEFEDYYILTYREKYKDHVLFNSYIEININKDGIKQANAFRITPIRFIDKKIDIYPVDEVLFNCLHYMKENKYSDNRIVNIEVGYDLLDNQIKKLVNGKALPYYKITLGNGEYFLINAYTNEIKN